MTPYNDSYPSCFKTYARLEIYGVSAEKVTTSLGLEPDETIQKGSVSVSALGKKVVALHEYWSISTEGKVRSLDLRRHLDDLISKLTAKANGLALLQGEPDIEIRVQCIWHSRGSGGPTLWPKQMQALAELDLELGIEFTEIEDDEEL